MPILELPPLPGTYLLCLWLNEAQTLKVGRLGEFFFPRGAYLYSGSARGPGGLRGRLKRHLLGSSKKHWHIDYIRQVAAPLGYVYQTLWSYKRVETVCLDEQPFISTIEEFMKLFSQWIREGCLAGEDGVSARQIPVECCWSKFLMNVPGVCIPAPGFGASDCRSGCAAHLVRLAGDL